MSDAHQDWLALVDQVLRGRDFDDVLVSATRDDIAIRPLYSYRDDDVSAVAAARGAVDKRRIRRGWDVRQRHCVGQHDVGQHDVGDHDVGDHDVGDHDVGQHDVGDHDVGQHDEHDFAVRAEILEDLKNGVTSVELCHSGVDDTQLELLLDGILDQFAVALAPHFDWHRAESLLRLASKQQTTLASGSSLGLDPLREWGSIADDGKISEVITNVVRLVTNGELSHGVRAFTIDATQYSNVSEAQAVAWATASGIECLRMLTSAGLSIDQAGGLIGFRWAVTADQFVSLSMLRAARTVWARVMTASGASPGAVYQYQQAVTDELMYKDRWENLLRDTTAALAAAVGGADAITVLPFDSAEDSTSDVSALGRRLARNTQLLLIEEAQIAKSVDPAGGSYFVESLTRSLAQSAWQKVQQISSDIQASRTE